MSLLPQRKKSAEEIAKLRESFGIPGQSPETEDAVERFAPTAAPAPSIPEPPPKAVPPPDPVPVAAELPVTVLGRDPIPTLEPETNPEVVHLDAVISGPPHEEPPAEEPILPEPAAHGPKRVRSLRKSEQGPLHLPPPPAAGSKLPFHRHSDREIRILKRNEALAPHPHPVPPAKLAAHPVIIIPAYLAAIIGAVTCFIYDTELVYPAVCEGFALLVALFIFVKKPLSRHHAGFLAMLAVMVVVFGALHYFPNLKYGT